MLPSQPRSSSWSTKPTTAQQPHLPPKPQFIKHLHNNSVRERQRATMQCVVKGSPDTQVKWYNNGNPIESSTDYMIVHDHLTGLCTLSIAEAFSPDSGQYTCVATNAAGSESSIAWLVVKPESPQKQPLSPQPPKTARMTPQAVPQTPLRLGTIESTKIDAPSSYSPPQPMKSVEIVRAYPKYPESPQQPQQPSTAEVDPSAMVKPSVLQALRDINLIEGGQAVFECLLQGNPLNIQWFKGEKEIKNQFRHKISFDEKTGVAKLYMTTVLEDDAGTYTCRATNQLGEAITSSQFMSYSNLSIYLLYKYILFKK